MNKEFVIGTLVLILAFGVLIGGMGAISLNQNLVEEQLSIRLGYNECDYFSGFYTCIDYDASGKVIREDTYKTEVVKDMWVLW